MRFNELRLAEPLVRAVAEEGYTAPTPIQTKAIPAVLAGKDVLGCAQTGTGKTGAFALPILDRLARPLEERGRGSRGTSVAPGRKPRALVVCPTRELAIQIAESFETYGRYLPLKQTAIFGGVPQGAQVRALRAGIDVLIATPGRLLDLIEQGFIDLSGIEVLVLDEADHMLDMGFIRDIRKVIKLLPTRRQTLLFSATMPPEIRRLADSILTDPVSVKAAPVASTADAVSQSVCLVARKNKSSYLCRLIREDGMGRTLIFTRTKHGADKLVKVLRRSGVEAGAIHGNKTQNVRTRTLNSFKSGKMPILVATDIAARGIDVDEITHVINYDMPSVPETYVHRIGRTARAAASGTAVSLVDREEMKNLRAIENLISMKLEIKATDPEQAHEAPKPKSTNTGRSPKPQRRQSPGTSGTSARGSQRRSRSRRPGRSAA